MVKKYVRRYSTFEVIQFTGDNTEELNNWIGLKQTLSNDNSVFIFPTIVGKYDCRINDYIIKDSNGVFYACSPERFNLNYEEDGK